MNWIDAIKKFAGKEVVVEKEVIVKILNPLSRTEQEYLWDIQELRRQLDATRASKDEAVKVAQELMKERWEITMHAAKADWIVKRLKEIISMAGEK